MLVLSRKKEESIRFEVPPSDAPVVIEMKVFEIARSIVRFGLTAPREVIIARTELLTETEDTPPATREATT